MLRQLEHLLVAERAHPDLFATCTLLTLDSHARKATLHLAGHHEPLLTTSTGTRKSRPHTACPWASPQA
ncbi:SpoIIE family protein phosphatase [Actinacidiphila glaucinigra]|uniref:SpoIIE family protein phosphatase n=1 Tax=Actinacidiphila glaucinigra TaxID=235986 RepID=UPI0036E8B78A